MRATEGRTILICVSVAALLLILYIMYRSRAAGPALNVEPNAAREIEKAKRR